MIIIAQKLYDLVAQTPKDQIRRRSRKELHGNELLKAYKPVESYVFQKWSGRDCTLNKFHLLWVFFFLHVCKTLRMFYIVSDKGLISILASARDPGRQNEKGVQSPVHKRALQRPFRARQV